jgi:hypothetical protein
MARAIVFHRARGAVSEVPKDVERTSSQAIFSPEQLKEVSMSFIEWALVAMPSIIALLVVLLYSQRYRLKIFEDWERRQS